MTENHAILQISCTNKIHRKKSFLQSSMIKIIKRIDFLGENGSLKISSFFKVSWQKFWRNVQSLHKIQRSFVIFIFQKSAVGSFEVRIINDLWEERCEGGKHTDRDTKNKSGEEMFHALQG